MDTLSRWLEGLDIRATLAAAALAFLASLIAVEDDDRYRGADAARDRALLEQRIQELERVQRLHERTAWHDQAGVEITTLRALLGAHERRERGAGWYEEP